MESPFSSTNHIFRTKEPFKDEFVPERILERDDVFEEYANHLQDIVDGFGAPNLFIYGGSGLGKTAMTEKMVEFLEQETDDAGIQLTVITVNCNKNSSTYGVIRRIVNSLYKDETYFNQGHHHEFLWEKIYERMDEIGGDFLIILDEIDQLGEDDTLLYEFPRARSIGEIDNSRVGLIGISNNRLYRDNLRTRVKSTLCESEIEFNPYDASELNNILRYYADLAFKDGVLDDQVVPLCAAMTAQETGDARLGLDLLETAGDMARSEEETRVTEDHVKQARHAVERANVKELFHDGLTLQQQLVLVATTFLELERGQAVKANQIYDTYYKLTDRLDVDKVGKRRIRDFLKILNEKGLLEADENNLGGRGGRWYSYTTVVGFRTLIEAFEEDPRLQSVVTSKVRHNLMQYERDNGKEHSPATV